MEGAAKFGRLAIKETDAWFTSEQNPSPSTEGTHLSDDGGATMNKIAALPDPTGVANPARKGWFTSACDPNGI
jgi:hypothetical protein